LSHLPFLLGERPGEDDQITLDLADLPHLLVAGTTGSGKSVFLNSLLVDLMGSLVDARYILIDPKRVEFAPYKPYVNSIYVEDVDVVIALEWLVEQMEFRYQALERRGVRDIADYNAIVDTLDDHLYRIVVVVDELANLMLSRQGPRIEVSLTRLAQMARAVGIHLVLATQRPTVDVVTGLLKANIPARVSFAVITQTDSRVILDEPGAERLLGKGELLARIPGRPGLHHLWARHTTLADVQRVITEVTRVD